MANHKSSGKKHAIDDCLEMEDIQSFSGEKDNELEKATQNEEACTY